MNGRTQQLMVRALARFGTVAIAAALCGKHATAQPPRQAGTLAIAGQTEQAALVRLNGRSYVDLESLARITHGTLQFEGSRAILALPGGVMAGAASEPAK